MPTLDPETFFNLYASWGVDGITHLSSISGYAKILLRDNSENLTDQQKEFLEIILQHSLRAHADWHHTNNYLVFSSMPDIPSQMVDLSIAIHRAVDYVREYAQMEKVTVKLPDELPLVKGNDWLERAFAYVLDPQPPGNEFIGYSEGYVPTIEARLVDSSHISIQINSGLQINSENIKRSSDLFHPGTPLSTARLIIQHCGSDLEVVKMEPGLEIRFTLPIWVESNQ